MGLWWVGLSVHQVQVCPEEMSHEDFYVRRDKKTVYVQTKLLGLIIITLYEPASVGVFTACTALSKGIPMATRQGEDSLFIEAT